MHAYVPWCFVILRISFREVCPCHLRTTLLDHFHDSWWLACYCKIPHVVSPMLSIFCWILFSIAAWYFAVYFLLLKCSHYNYALVFFPSEFSPFNSFTYASFCFLYAAGMWGRSFVTHWRPSQLLPRAFLSLAGNVFHRNDGHFTLTRNQGTKSTEK